MTGATLRFLTLNLWGDNGPWGARMALLADRLGALAPDVVALQEVREVPGRVENQAAVLARRYGWHHVFVSSTSWGGGQEGLAILSRFPIGAHEHIVLPHSTETEGRILLSARIDSPLGELWAHTTHLSFREHEGRKREEQMLAIDEVVAARDQNVRVLMGDFNAMPDSDEIRWMVGATTLGGRRVAYQDAWDRVHPDEPGFTWARANPYIERLHWLRPDRRLDYIFVSPARRDRRGTIRDAQIVLAEPRLEPGGEKVFVSDHFGVMADVQYRAEPIAAP